MIFLYCDITELWGHGRIMKAGNGETGPSTKSYLKGKPVRRRRSVKGSEIKVAKFMNPCRREKPLLFMLYPYRKPTQVDEERILRSTEEALLRNSAK